MKRHAFRPRNDRERLAFEAGRSDGLREAIQLLAQNRPLAAPEPRPAPEQAADPAPEPSAEVARLEDLLVGLGFTPFTDEENPARQWRRGDEEVAIEEANAEEQVRWWPPDPEQDEPATLTLGEAIHRAGEESRGR